MKRHQECSHQSDNLAVKFPCTEPGCSRIFSLQHQLKRHLLVHAEGRYRCDLCSLQATAATESSVTEASTEPSSSTTFATDNGIIAAVTFTRKSHLRAHQLAVHGSDYTGYRCDQCTAHFTAPSRLAKHRASHHTPKTYICGECTLIFPKWTALLAHRREAHKERVKESLESSATSSFPCDRCDKTYSSKNGLSVHQRVVHENDRPHECPTCQSCFAYKHLLKRHIHSIHERPNDCGDSLIETDSGDIPSRAILNVCGLEYEAERPFACSHCRQRFLRQFDLDRHLRASHQHSRIFAN